MTELKTASIETLPAKIKFYLQKTAENVVEIGKRLILAKEMVEHGKWADWLEINFALKVRMAQRFMVIADRFSNTSLKTHFDILSFNQTQLVEMLALPAGDEEKLRKEINKCHEQRNG